MEQTQIQITTIGKDIETANDAIKCTSEAITKMKEAAGSVSMPTMSVSLSEEDLRKECRDLYDAISFIRILGRSEDSWTFTQP